MTDGTSGGGADEPVPVPIEPEGPAAHAPADVGASAPPGPSKWPWILTGSAIGVLATLVIVLAVVLATRDEQVTTPPATTPATAPSSTGASTTTTTASTTSTTVATTRPNGDLRGIALRLDAMLGQAAQARSDVAAVIDQVQASCELDPGIAQQKLYDVVQSRTQTISQLSALQVTGNEEADRLVALMLTGMQDSQHATQHFQQWVNQEYAKYYYDNTTWDPGSVTGTTACPGEPPKGPLWDEAVAASDEATQAKQQFVAAYNPVAQRFGLRTWKDTEI